MNEEQTRVWVKDKQNQRTVLEHFFRDNPASSGKIAFFMAGIPGSGKTEFTNEIVKEFSEPFVRIEHDRIVEYIEGYRPEDYYNFRRAGSTLVTKIFEDCLRHGYNFVFDGTLAHERGASNIAKTLKAGYTVIVVYIVQDTSKAWELTQAREALKKRAIELQGFLHTCSIINQNLLNIFRANTKATGFRFWLLDKRGATTMKDSTAIIHSSDNDHEKEIEFELQKTYNVSNIIQECARGQR